MKKEKNLFFSAALIIFCAALTICAAALRFGDVVGYVLSTEIVAYIDGRVIDSYNVDGNLCVVAEDLGRYGFSVNWDDKARTLSVSKSDTPITAPVILPEQKEVTVGRILMPVLHTDIVTYLDGEPVQSYNIDGKTIIRFSALDRYGTRVYDDGAKISMLSTRGALPEAVTLTEVPEKIIHACGQVNGIAGSNSIEALDATYARGYRFIEMDFLLSSDGHPVALHDWSSYYSTKISGTPLTLEEFLEVKIFGKYTPLWLDSVADWFSEHPDAYLITDVKDDNIAVLAEIADKHPQLLAQILPQIYFPSEYGTVRALGYSNIIFTLYRYGTYNDKVNTASHVKVAERLKLLAFTADSTIVNQKFADEMKKSGALLFTHTVNDADEQQKYYDFGVDGIYTDYTK